MPIFILGLILNLYGIRLRKIYLNRTTCRDSLQLLCHLWGNKKYSRLLHCMKNNLFFSRIPSGLEDWGIVFHKSGTLVDDSCVVNDMGIVNAAEPFAIAFLTEGQKDVKGTETEIAHTVREISKYIKPDRRLS